ncbi:hypothetical protein RHGRI_025764 [Rhododendron griersonianum]|uniref:Uncharacterized protein n=1 Tax=Rhododendron griersonianum TaxID=479676 RepID=A0AAV6IRK8_9ERIC|nr:hypothetical protein RHGRI_025764 [Rhododendron griersonianum]
MKSLSLSLSLSLSVQIRHRPSRSSDRLIPSHALPATAIPVRPRDDRIADLCLHAVPPNNDPTTTMASSAANLHGSITLHVPVIVSAIRLLLIAKVVVPSVVRQPAVFAVNGGRSIRV